MSEIIRTFFCFLQIDRMVVTNASHDTAALRGLSRAKEETVSAWPIGSRFASDRKQ